MALGGGSVAAVDVGWSQVIVVGLAREDEGDEADDRVSDGDGSPLRAASGFESVGLRAEGGTGAASGAGGFHEGTAEGGVARAGLAGLAFAGALVVAGAQPGPRGELGWGRGSG